MVDDLPHALEIQAHLQQQHEHHKSVTYSGIAMRLCSYTYNNRTDLLGDLVQLLLGGRGVDGLVQPGDGQRQVRDLHHTCHNTQKPIRRVSQQQLVAIYIKTSAAWT